MLLFLFLPFSPLQIVFFLHTLHSIFLPCTQYWIRIMQIFFLCSSLLRSHRLHFIHSIQCTSYAVVIGSGSHSLLVYGLLSVFVTSTNWQASASFEKRLHLCVRMPQMMSTQMMKIRSIRRIRYSMWIEKTSSIARRSECTRWWRRHGWAIYIHSRVLLFPFGTTILEPNFYLFSTIQRRKLEKSKWTTKQIHQLKF